MLDGALAFDDAHLYSEVYGFDFLMDPTPVEIRASQMNLKNYALRSAKNENPLLLNGTLDMRDFSRIGLNFSMRANNFELINAKRNSLSLLYGKVYANYLGTLKGTSDNISIRGKLEILDRTDMTYILKDSPLTVDDRLHDLVQFVSFRDSAIVEENTPLEVSGFDLTLGISISDAARFRCSLSEDGQNYVNLEGGGDLTMRITQQGDMRLTGRFTANSGEMKYSLPIIPLRTFQIQDGSYIQWTGNPMKPTLNITATEDVKTAVASSDNSQGRIVDFDCGVRLSKTFPDMGVEFVIDAPEDAQMRNELNMKSAEERSKLAVSMLASGMYLDSNVGNFAMNSALASFLQTEVNKITGSAFRSMGLDLTANLESTADATGALHTDYTFKFSKRILNNRLRISMGGRVSTGATAADDNGAYFDNFSLEYRLNQKETQYLKLYYEREAYDWLEGNISVFGGGFSWRRKLRHFKDIFKLKSDDAAVIPVIRTDSTQRKLP